MTSIASNIRSERSPASGQYPAMTCSFSASPEPTPSHDRPGYIASSVAAACATIAGWNRKLGHVTPGPMSPRVRSPTAVSTFHTNAASPCCGTHGWKWSAAMQPENPFASANAVKSTTSCGPNCSSIAA
jgi:hypothetical protein